MKNDIKYEWDYETLDGDGDIVDHHHEDNLFRFSKSAYDCISNVRLVLVRDVGNDVAGLIDRSWAYVDDHDKKLPRYFSDSNDTVGVLVPKKFHIELAKYLQS